MIDAQTGSANTWWWVAPSVTLAAAFGGGLLGSYISKKQKSWDLKRDIALDVMRVFGEIQQLINSIFHQLRPGESHEDIRRIAEVQGQAAAMTEAGKIGEQRLQLANEYGLAMRKFWQVKGTVSMVFSEKTLRLMNDVQNALAHVVSLLGPSHTDEEAKARIEQLEAKKELLTKALRSELKI